MHVQCAWCQKDLTPAPTATPTRGDITHGICPECADYFFTKRDHSLRTLLNSLGKPILVVDDDAHVLDASDSVLAQLNMTAEQVRGSLAGDVIECANAKLPQGCGHTVHCLACAIRNCVRETAETGQPFTRVPAWIRQHNAYAHPATWRTRYLISTEKVGPTVLLRIDDMTLAKATITPSGPSVGPISLPR